MVLRYCTLVRVLGFRKIDMSDCNASGPTGRLPPLRVTWSKSATASFGWFPPHGGCERLVLMVAFTLATKYSCHQILRQWPNLPRDQRGSLRHHFHLEENRPLAPH